MICLPRVGLALCMLVKFQLSCGAKWVFMEKYDERDSACSGTPTKEVSPWALEDTCLSVGTAGLRDWMVEGGSNSQELYVKVMCTDNAVHETVYSNQECTTLAVSGNGKNSSVERPRSCAEHDVSWSFFKKFGYTKFICGNDYPVIAWSEFSDSECKTRKEKGVTYEADGGCYSLAGVENWVGDGMNSKTVTCSAGVIVWTSYASSDCSGSVVQTDDIASAECSYSAFHFGHVKMVGGHVWRHCASSVSFAFQQRIPFHVSFLLVLALKLTIP